MTFKDFNGKLTNQSVHQLAFFDDPTNNFASGVHSSNKESIVTSYKKEGVCIFVPQEADDAKNGTYYGVYYSNNHSKKDGERSFQFYNAVCETEEEVDKIILELKSLDEQDTAQEIFQQAQSRYGYRKNERSL